MIIFVRLFNFARIIFHGFVKLSISRSIWLRVLFISVHYQYIRTSINTTLKEFYWTVDFFHSGLLQLLYRPTAHLSTITRLSWRCATHSKLRYTCNYTIEIMFLILSSLEVTSIISKSISLSSVNEAKRKILGLYWSTLLDWKIMITEWIASMKALFGLSNNVNILSNF